MKKTLTLLVGACAVLLLFALAALLSVPAQLSYTGQAAAAADALPGTPAATPSNPFALPQQGESASAPIATTEQPAPATPAPASAPAGMPASAQTTPASQPAAPASSANPAPTSSPAPMLVPYSQLVPAMLGQGGGSTPSSSSDSGSSNSTPAVAPAPAPDTTPPVIAAISDISATTASDSATTTTVTYTTPTATDNVDGTDPVSCTPTSGSTFALGTTPVTCTSSDAAGNTATSTFNIIVDQLPDTTPPVIAAISDISTTTSATSLAVAYTSPTAFDDKDGTTTVSCTPASGSTFNVGTTTVTCTSSDAAGNTATSSFDIGVTQVSSSPTPGSSFVMASQPDQSYLCTPDWTACYTGGGSQFTTPLGSGADFQTGTLSSVTIAKEDDISLNNEYNSTTTEWTIDIICFLDTAYTQPCSGDIFTSAQTSSTTDNIHWSAPFDFTFDPTKYYELGINDAGWPISAYGTPTEPYWVMTGIAN